MPSVRDVVVGLVVFSALEGLLINTFAPQLRPVGGVGRLLERFFILNFVLYQIYRIVIYPRFFSPYRNIPGPPQGNFVANGIKSITSKPPGDKLRQLADEYGREAGVVKFFDVLGNEVLLPCSHEMLKSILVDNTYDWEKPSKVAGILRTVIGDGLILSEAAGHKFQRKHLMPSFQHAVIKNLYPIFWQKACELTSMLKDEASQPEFEFGIFCTRVTLDIIGIAGFGRDFGSIKNPNDELVQDFQELLEPAPQKALLFTIAIIVSPAFALNVPIWEVPKTLKRISKHLYDWAYQMTADRRTELTDPKVSDEVKEKRNDILSFLVKSNDFTDTELAHQCLTMIAAGHETTSNTLGWCTYLLAQYPDLQRELRDEIRAALPSPDNIHTETISASVVDSMPLLNAVCNETLRLYPVVPVTIRNAVRKTTLGPYPISEGQTILLSPWAINRNKGIWGEDANEFTPSRWINDDGKPNNTGGVTSNYSTLTFLHGPRSCIGQGFAKGELKCLVAAIVGRYDIQITREKETYFPAGIVTTKAANGMWLKFTEVPGW